ncbi:MAG: HAMP domain-containing protein [Lachnospiraceae bacterium]|nr:HAMP domain-containing protein [Lachnospiraceae bacterium]
MKKVKQIMVVITVIILAAVALTGTVNNSSQPINQFYTISAASDGNTLATWYDEKNITVAVVNREGKISKSKKIPVEKGDLLHKVEAACMGEDNKVYVLLRSCENDTGNSVKEELYIYDFNKWLSSPTIISTDELQVQTEDATDTEHVVWSYKWMNANGSALSLIGVNSDSTKAVRKVFEFGEVTSRSLNIKSERIYPLAEGEGIYQAIGNGTDIAYISNSGKLYHATESQVQEVYPAREVDVLMYPLYLFFAETGYVYTQEAETGNILKLSLTDGSEEVKMKGTAAFSAAEVITPADICMMSMTNISNFSSVIRDSSGNGYNLFVLQDDTGYLIKSIEKPISQLALMFLESFLSYLAVTVALILVIFGIFYGIIKGKTIVGKLILAALPLMILAMSVFGIIAYHFYWDSVVSSYEKQTVDEGNMMTALFGQESFDTLEYPYDYSSENYNYLSNQIEGRELYSKVVYFEDGDLYTGVDKNTPCFYPISIKMNVALEDIYQKAALSGEVVTATIQDRDGERIVSVTPVGGSAGRSVYLYEAGVYTAVLDEYQSSYVKNFVWICIVFLFVVSILLIAMFLQILQPLSEIREGMEKFTNGNRDIRIEPETRDELAGICQAFNKMADDIDLQIMNLQNLSDTYYRFMPLSIIGILGRDNLDNLNLGSKIQGSYAVLSVQIRNREENNSFQMREEEINRFFNLINTQAVKQNAIPIVDSANLSSMLLICKEGVASAIRTALAILASVDAYNAGTEDYERLELMFLLHRSDIFVGICGDEERYIPVLITPELENILQKKETFRQVGSRLLVTGQTFRELEKESDFENRYIGTLGIEDNKGGFYEFYDDRETGEVHLLKVTDSNFRKAMKLYEQGYLYEAKNLFAMVLQDNPDDMVARYYIFRCE